VGKAHPTVYQNGELAKLGSLQSLRFLPVHSWSFSPYLVKGGPLLRETEN
jgi:hypothetical protein